MCEVGGLSVCAIGVFGVHSAAFGARRQTVVFFAKGKKIKSFRRVRYSLL